MNKELGVKWYKIAAENGDALAKNSLAICYETGEGVEKNIETAFHWYLESALEGHDHGQYNVSIAYEEGDGTEINHEKAFYWLQQATKQNHPQALFRISRFLSEGIGCEIDMEKSYEYLLRASKTDEKQTVEFAKIEIENFQKSSKTLSAHLDYHKMYKKLIFNQSKVDEYFDIQFHFFQSKEDVKNKQKLKLKNEEAE